MLPRAQALHTQTPYLVRDEMAHRGNNARQGQDTAGRIGALAVARGAIVLRVVLAENGQPVELEMLHRLVSRNRCLAQKNNTKQKGPTYTAPFITSPDSEGRHQPCCAANRCAAQRAGSLLRHILLQVGSRHARGRRYVVRNMVFSSRLPGNRPSGAGRQAAR